MTHRKHFQLKLRSGVLALGERTLVMGVLNVTPDSFSDGGKYFNVDAAIEHGLRMERDGAHILDVGAESTRPGSQSISPEEELKRILPVLGGLRRSLKIPISIDTQKFEVAEPAIEAGAQIINDISGLRSDPRIASLAARTKTPLVLMHMRGEPRTMQKGPFARNVIADVTKGLRQALAAAHKAGLAESQMIVDPGIGFGKSHEQNYELIQKLPLLARLGYPILIGTSRKGFIGATLALTKEGLAREGKTVPVERRIWGTAATVTASILGGAHIVRVHDVAEMAQVARVADCLLTSPR